MVKRTIKYWTKETSRMCAKCAERVEWEGAKPVHNGTEHAEKKPRRCTRCDKFLGNRLDETAMEELIERLQRYNPRNREKGATEALVRAYASALVDSGKIDVLVTGRGVYIGKRSSEEQRNIVEELKKCASLDPDSHTMHWTVATHRIVASPEVARKEDRPDGVYPNDNVHMYDTAKALCEFSKTHFSELEIEQMDGKTMQLKLAVHTEEKETQRAKEWVNMAWREVHGGTGTSEKARLCARATQQGRDLSTLKERVIDDGRIRIEAECEIEVEDYERGNAVERCEVPDDVVNAVQTTRERLGAKNATTRTVHNQHGTSIAIEADL